jgi:hypothetical protein
MRTLASQHPTSAVTSPFILGGPRMLQNLLRSVWPCKLRFICVVLLSLLPAQRGFALELVCSQRELIQGAVSVPLQVLKGNWINPTNNERYTFDDAGGVVRTRADGEKEVGVLFEDKLQGCDCKLMYEDGSSAYYKIEYSDSRLVFGQRTCSGQNEFFLMKQK